MSMLETFKSVSITGFLEEIDRNNFIWIVKRLSGNDTGLTGGHQAGLYLPRRFFELTFPEICNTKKYNPDFFIDECYFPSDDLTIRGLRAIYYNSKYFPEKRLKKKYDEFRLTRWGGHDTPLQNDENTGSIFIFAVKRLESKAVSVAWVASSVEEENLIEGWLGEEVEPGRFILRPSDYSAEYEEFELKFPIKWKSIFPTGQEIFQFVINHISSKNWKKSIDELLLRRREYEFKIFEMVEQQTVFPRIQNGFKSVEEFIKYSHSISNRRKSRTGLSLELNLEAIFHQEKLVFEKQVITENRKKPDFLFPSGLAYHDHMFPPEQLHMLASKTCCKDRWRQIINEADRIELKHLFTLQQGVSSNQLQEMKDSNVKLVVPEPFLKTFPGEWRKSLLTLGNFIEYIKKQQKSIKNLEKWIN